MVSMVAPHPSLLKSKQTLDDFSSMKGPSPPYCSSCSNTTTNSMKIKTLIHSHFLRHVCQVVQALNKAKSMFMELLLNKNREESNYYLDTFKMKIKRRRKKKKMKVFSSIRLHYNWCSSHVLPMPDDNEPAAVISGGDGGGGGGLTVGASSHVYYDSTWSNSIVHPADDYCYDSPELSGYLQWLDEKVPAENTNSSTIAGNGVDGDIDEIDRLADKFIASFHEKFRLEKQESYRRYQEMLARSV